MLNYGVRTENYYDLPPGPNNLVGIPWMGLNKSGIGIHKDLQRHQSARVAESADNKCAAEARLFGTRLRNNEHVDRVGRK
jgi:hypothetical protein